MAEMEKVGEVEQEAPQAPVKRGPGRPRKVVQMDTAPKPRATAEQQPQDPLAQRIAALEEALRRAASDAQTHAARARDAERACDRLAGAIEALRGMLAEREGDGADA